MGVYVGLCAYMCVHPPHTDTHTHVHRQRKLVGIADFWVVTSEEGFYFSLYILLCQFDF